MSPEQSLDDILSQGIQIDLFRAEQCFALREVIAEHADGINSASFGNVFGSLQQILHRFALLSVAKVFEVPDNRYPLRSIPAALTLLNKHASDFAVWYPDALINILVKFDHKAEELKRLSYSELTATLYTEYSRRLPKPVADSGAKLDKTLYAIKTVRDKYISHNEAISLDDIPEADFESITGLIQFGLEFLQTIGLAYLSVSYSGTVGEFLKTTDAASASRGLKRLFQTMNIGREM